MDSDLLDCSICLTRFQSKIYLCEGGHSFCEKCTKMMRMCPKCNKAMTSKRNYDMETFVNELNKNVKFACRNKGCTYKLSMDQQTDHEAECKYRTHLCQVSAYSGAKCTWIGTYDELLNHYKQKHPDNCRLSAVTKKILITPVFHNFKDTQLLPFLDGKQMFYYKHKIDKDSGLAFWVFEFVGPEKEAANYTYEFEINKEHRKFKVNGICGSDSKNCEVVMARQDCVCLTLKQLKNYVNEEGDIDVRFRISTINYIPGGNKTAPVNTNEIGHKMKRLVFNK